MNRKNLLNPHRVRRISGSFAFIEHRFLQEGFWDCLERDELLLYLFLVLVSDRQGLSWYSSEKICKRLRLCPEAYKSAREGLIQKDLLRFDGFLFQVLSLPEKPVSTPPSTRQGREEGEWVRLDPQSLGRLVASVFHGKVHEQE